MDCGGDDEENERDSSQPIYLGTPSGTAMFTLCMACTNWSGDANDKQSDRGLTIAIDAIDAKNASPSWKMLVLDKKGPCRQAKLGTKPRAMATAHGRWFHPSSSFKLHLPSFAAWTKINHFILQEA